MSDQSELLRRIERLESIDAIRQLAAKYSLALDMRDSDAWVGLFPEDVRVGGGKSGRKALRDWFDETHSRQFDGTSHHIGGHIITGGARGIAKGIATAFVKVGASLFIVDREEELGHATEAELAALREVGFMPLDLANHDALKSIVASAVEPFGRLDILVNAA
jgi:hypothetical protein